MTAFLLDNIRSLYLTFFGSLMMFFVLAKTAGCRYSKKITCFVWMLVWLFRYSFYSLYMANYLAGLYQGQEWFSNLVLFLNAANLWMCMILIAFLFKGRLRKNMVTVAVFEMTYAVLTMIPHLLYSFFVHGSTMAPLMNDINIMDFIMPVYTGVILWAFLCYGDPYLKRYAGWNSSHPVMVNLFLFVYLTTILIGNFDYVQTRGNMGFVLYVAVIMMVFVYFIYDYLYTEREKEKKRYLELVYREKALRNHYERVREQADKIRLYNREIRDNMDALLKKISDSEGNNGEGSGESSEETAAYEDNINSMVSGYFKILKEHYQELSFRSWCDDPLMDQLLRTYDGYFKDKGIEAVFCFQDYRTPPGISGQDVEQILMWMLDWAVAHLSKQSRADRTGLVLQGGVVREELILSCHLTGADGKISKNRSIRRLLKKVNGDISIISDENVNKVLIGIPIGPEG